jgi:hypothetical protein
MARQLRCDEYTVGWICALPVELAAAQEMLDEEHDAPPSTPTTPISTPADGSASTMSSSRVCLKDKQAHTRLLQSLCR